MAPEPAGITLADGGIETALADRLGRDLPEFAAFVLLDTGDGREALRDYYRPFIELAAGRGCGIVLDTPTWRASADWGAVLGYDEEALARVNADAVALVRTLAVDTAPSIEATVNGSVGPRSDDYVAGERMTPDEAERYHAPQVRALAEAGADRVTAVTALDAPEAIGVVRAARGAGIPVAVSFAVGADGRLADGSTLAETIVAVDEATGSAADGFLVNCAHPEELRRGVDGEPELSRIAGLRLNAARHGEDAGDDPRAFAEAVLALREQLPAVAVIGGCCGTDIPHIAAIAELARA